jgi:hypothetical protein
MTKIIKMSKNEQKRQFAAVPNASEGSLGRTRDGGNFRRFCHFFNSCHYPKGTILVYNVVVIFIFSMVMLAVLGYAASQLKVVRSTVNREMAFQIAEAGVNYYQWRLAHYPDDFWDGNASTTPGPYVHDYIDKDTNQKIGEFSLEITQPLVGSTIVNIASTGYTMDNPAQKRTVNVRYGIPSLAKYALLTNTDVWIGSSENISGEMHANGGIRFDGTGNAPISTFKNDYPTPGPGYQCQTYHGCGPTWRPGIWGAAPTSTQAFWQMSVPYSDFTSITSNFNDIEALATGQADLPASTVFGYSLVFNSNATVDVYKVTALRSHVSGTDVNNVVHTEDLDYLTRVFQYNMPMPTNGVIFVKDHVWVEGVVNGRVAVAATVYSTNPALQARILIPNNITYLAKDGNHSLGLIAEKDVLITYYAPSVLEVNAAMIAQKGSAQVYNFSTPKTSITIYGSVASFGVWTWSWVNGAGTCTSGYCNTYTTYDSNLLYAPPPSFPLSTDGYQQITWTSN